MAKTKKKTAKPAARKTAKVAARATKKSAKITAKPKGKSAKKKVDPLNRKNYGAMTPMLAVRDVKRAVDFYTRAFGFKLRGRVMEGPDGSAMHAELKLREATLMLGPENAGQGSLSAQSIGNTPATLFVLVDNVDAVYNRAVAAGGQTLMPVADMFWGDRVCTVADPEGNKWMIATHKSEPTPAQMRAAMERQMQQGASGSESEY